MYSLAFRSLKLNALRLKNFELKNILKFEFKKPQPPEKWEGIREAVERPPGCVPHARPDGMQRVLCQNGEMQIIGE